MNYSSPGFSVHGLLSARIVDWVALLQGIFPTQGSNPHLLSLLHLQTSSLPLAPPRFCRRTQKYYVYSLKINQDSAPRLHCCFLSVPPLSLHPFPSLISNCLNLPFGTLGRSRSLNDAHFIQTRNERQRKDLYPETPRVLLAFRLFSFLLWMVAMTVILIWTQKIWEKWEVEFHKQILCQAYKHSSETEGKREGHNLLKNDIAQGYSINWLESAMSKTVEYLTSSESWASSDAHCNTLAC